MSLQRMYNLTQRQVQVPSICCCIRSLWLQNSPETRVRFSCNENLIALGRPPQILSGLRFTQPRKRDPFLCDTIGATLFESLCQPRGTEWKGNSLNGAAAARTACRIGYGSSRLQFAIAYGDCERLRLAVRRTANCALPTCPWPARHGTRVSQRLNPRLGPRAGQ